MKIRFYTNSFYPDPIGIAFYNAELVEHLVDSGHDVDVITAMPYYPQWNIADGYRGRWRVEENFKGARVVRTWVFVPRRQTPLGRFLCEFSFMVTSFVEILRGRPDWIIAVSPPFGAGLAAAAAARLRGTALWLHLQDLQVDAGAAVGFFRSGWLIAILKGLERWVLRRASRLTTISAPMRERVVGKGIAPDRIALFPNWVDTRAMRPLPRENGFRKQHGLTGRFVVLYAGSVGIHQGLDFLLEAAEKLADEPDIAFVIAGDGNDRERLARRLEQVHPSNVILLPLQPKERLAEMLSSADVGIVMETRQMANLSLPSKSLNQMACGRPIVAVTAPETALARSLTENDAGVVVTPGNAEQLAITLHELSRSRSRLERMGEHARDYVERELNRDTIWARLPELLSPVPATPPTYREYRLKRPLDSALATLGFVVSLPIWMLVPVAIWLEDRGPVFYPQERVGRGGRPFRAYKFRSMQKMELPQFDRRQARRGDPRVTRVGRWLRRTAMDEVPQLWNIFKGDMSFVGPRALLPSEVEVRREFQGEVPLAHVPGFAARAAMRPGLTGVAQIYAARDITRRNKFRYDLLYRGRQGLFFDIALILRSGWNSLCGKWEAVGQQSPDQSHPFAEAGRQDKTRYPALDGLRAVAIVLVLLYHFDQRGFAAVPGLGRLFSTGWTGVYLFFALSGFLVGGLAFKEARTRSALAIPRFWSRRFFRTWPLYFVLLFFDLLKGGRIVPSWIHFITFTQNFYPIMFFVRSWSLAVEEQFYVFLPVLIWGLLQRRRLNLLLPILAALFFLAYLFRLGNGFSQFTYHTLGVMDPLLLGIGIAFLQQFHPRVLEPLIRRPNRMFGLGLLLSYGLFLLPEASVARQIGMPAALGAGYGLMVLAALNPALILRPVLCHPASRFIARISYSLYLIHGHFTPTLYVLAGRWQFTGAWRTGFLMSGWWVTSLASAIILYYGIERPALRLRELYFPRSIHDAHHPPQTISAIANYPDAA